MVQNFVLKLDEDLIVTLRSYPISLPDSLAGRAEFLRKEGGVPLKERTDRRFPIDAIYREESLNYSIDRIIERLPCNGRSITDVSNMGDSVPGATQMMKAIGIDSWLSRGYDFDVVEQVASLALRPRYFLLVYVVRECAVENSDKRQEVETRKRASE